MEYTDAEIHYWKGILEYNISIEELEKENQIENITNKIIEIAKNANKNYKDRMLV